MAQITVTGFDEVAGVESLTFDDPTGNIQRLELDWKTLTVKFYVKVKERTAPTGWLLQWEKQAKDLPPAFIQAATQMRSLALAYITQQHTGLAGVLE